MDLHVTLNGKRYKMTYTEDVVTQMVAENGNFNSIIRDLEEGESEVASLPVNEEFFFMGNKNSYQGVLREDEIHLVTLIPNRNVI